MIMDVVHLPYYVVQCYLFGIGAVSSYVIFIVFDWYYANKLYSPSLR